MAGSPGYLSGTQLGSGDASNLAHGANRGKVRDWTQIFAGAKRRARRSDERDETRPGASVAGGFPPGSLAGHDHDYARLRLLGLLAERDVPATVANDFADLEKWLPSSRLLITYVAGPYPEAGQCRALQGWLEAGGHWLGLHGTSGGRAERVEGTRQRRTVKTEHHALLGCRFLTHPPIREIRVEVSDPIIR